MIELTPSTLPLHPPIPGMILICLTFPFSYMKCKVSYIVSKSFRVGLFFNPHPLLKKNKNKISKILTIFLQGTVGPDFI
jgi:hypothetical protein